MRFLGLALVLVFAAPAALAGTAAMPELKDPDKDVVVDRTSQALPDPWAAAIDLQSVWFDDDAAGLHATIKVRDLSAASMTDTGIMADTFWIAIWSPSYAHPGEVANRTGTWELRAEYRPLDTSKWHFWLERPCTDGNSDDGCSGVDRDILDGLEGTVDVQASTIRMTVPWRHMGEPSSGDFITGLWAAAEMVWPSYPVYSADWDTDQGGACYRFTATLPVPDSGSDSGAVGSSDGRGGLPVAYGPWPPCLPQYSYATRSPTSTHPVPATTTSAIPSLTNGTGPASATSATKSAPALPWGAALAAIAMVAVRRRLR